MNNENFEKIRIGKKTYTINQLVGWILNKSQKWTYSELAVRAAESERDAFNPEYANDQEGVTWAAAYACAFREAMKRIS